MYCKLRLYVKTISSRLIRNQIEILYALELPIRPLVPRPYSLLAQVSQSPCIRLDSQTLVSEPTPCPAFSSLAVYKVVGGEE